MPNSYTLSAVELEQRLQLCRDTIAAGINVEHMARALYPRGTPKPSGVGDLYQKLPTWQAPQ